MNKFHYKGSTETKSGQKVAGTDSHREQRTGKNPTKESKSQIRDSVAGRHLHETEHSVRMGHSTTSSDTLPFTEGNGTVD